MPKSVSAFRQSVMRRADFRQLAQLRIREAKILLDNACYEGAYYLAGYAVECALKACISKLTQKHEFPLTEGEARMVYSHKLKDLLIAAGLADAMKGEEQVKTGVAVSWGIIKEWNEQKRYDSAISAATAAALYNAIVDKKDGMLIWLKKWW